MIEAAIAFLAEVAVKSTLLIVLAALAAWIARRGPAAVRHRIWCSALAGVAALPLVMLLMPRWGVPVLPSEPVQASPAPVVDRTAGTDTPAATPSVSADVRAPLERPFPWGMALLGLYAAGIAASALGLGLSLSRLRRLARQSYPASERTLRTLKWLAGLLGISPPLLRVARHGGPTVPMTWGARRPVLLLPHGADTWPEEYLRSALAHEAAHIRRRDWVVQIAVRLICVFYWFHPLARWAAARLRIEAERACDDLALLSGIPAADYAACLLEVTRMNREDRPDRQLALAALPMAQSTALGERLRAVLDAEAQRQERRRGLGVVITVAAVTAVLVTGALQATPSRPSVARTTDMALALGMIQGRTSVKIAPKSKSSLQAEVNALRARLRATEAEVRRLRARSSGVRLFDAKLEEGSGAGRVAVEEKRLIDLRRAEAERAAASAALADAQAQQLALESERAKAAASLEARRAREEADSAALRERARALDALKAQSYARARQEKDLRSRQEQYERAFRAQAEAEEILKRGRGDLRDLKALEEARRSGRVEDPAGGSPRGSLSRPVPSGRGPGYGGVPSRGAIDRHNEAFEPRRGSAPLGAGGDVSSGSPRFGGASGRRPASQSYDEELENLEDQIRHIDLDIQFARRRLERAEQRVKVGTAPIEEAEEAQLKLQHLELDRAAVMRRIERLNATRRPGSGGVGR